MGDQVTFRTSVSVAAERAVDDAGVSCLELLVPETEPVQDAAPPGIRPGVLDRLGLGYEELKAANPSIVYCSLSSYGHRGPKRDLIAHDVNILADIGLLDLIGSEDGPPTIPGVQLADTVTSLYAAFGIVASLLE